MVNHEYRTLGCRNMANKSQMFAALMSFIMMVCLIGCDDDNTKDEPVNSVESPVKNSWDVEDLGTGLNRPTSIALDVAAGKVYWTDDWRNIIRANLDGSNVEVLITNDITMEALGTRLEEVSGIALDAVAGKMYWTWHRGRSGKIQRANLDGPGRAMTYSKAKGYWEQF